MAPSVETPHEEHYTMFPRLFLSLALPDVHLSGGLPLLGLGLGLPIEGVRLFTLASIYLLRGTVFGPLQNE
jgi:hypothetical protein